MRADWQVLAGADVAPELRAEWRALQAESTWHSVFTTYGWNKPLLDRHGALVLVVRDKAGDCVGVAPLVSRQGRVALRRKEWFHFAGMPHSDHGGMLVRAGAEPRVAAALREFLDQQPSRVAGLSLANIPIPALAASQVVNEVARQGGTVIVCPPTRIRRLSAATYWRNTRQRLEASRGLRKDDRRLRRSGAVTFSVPADRVGKKSALEQFAQLWRTPGSTSAVVLRHLGALIDDLPPDGEVLISSLQVDSASVAIRASLLSAGVLHLYATAYDPAFASFSPGILQLRLLLDWAFHNGVKEVDFGMGMAPHKDLVEPSECYEVISSYVVRSRLDGLELRAYVGAKGLAARGGLTASLLARLRRLVPYG